MSIVTTSTNQDSTRATRSSSGRRGTLLWVMVAIGALFVVSILSLVVGASSIDPATVVRAIVSYDPTNTDHLIVIEKRLPRTLIGLAVGAALGLAGTVAQGLTRNPIADPGILGVNFGASLLVVLGISIAGVTTLSGYVWFAFAGAALASILVYSLSALGRDGATPVKLALVGSAVSAACASLITAVMLTNTQVLNSVRFWQVGAIAGRGYDVFWQMLPACIAGVAIALALGRQINGLALGDDVARGLGQRVGLTRVLGALAIVLLCGSATSAAGPIAFVGLAVPHIARMFTGSDYRRILPFSIVLGAIMLLACDVLGRVVAPPGELEVGIVAAFVGAPFFLALVRRRKLPTL
ncbi:iron ABC transporter permease [Microbacterium sp. cx-59]|uniref:FecCD family ABC transporter permease n=1 Tax=Microbacterium sp. cx-59 TaxID=2891207 RepID=UPI001E3CD4D1|nr:iron chelate uptake ABC transporter family permease subunit [Microbacterium sp. cx-59]MCC4909222.1 iron ABC transporter permease [Microbacterium sp. cx-59]